MAQRKEDTIEGAVNDKAGEGTKDPVTTTTGTTSDAGSTGITGEGGESDGKDNKPATKPETKPKPKPRTAKADDAETPVIPERIINTLKGYPTYSEVYIDHLTGVFAPTTPELIRKTAVLYENPFYEQ